MRKLLHKKAIALLGCPGRPSDSLGASGAKARVVRQAVGELDPAHADVVDGFHYPAIAPPEPSALAVQQQRLEQMGDLKNLTCDELDELSTVLKEIRLIE